MSISQDITRISVQGSKECIIKMLNAAIRNVGTSNLIVPEDNIETINLKVKETDSKFGLRIAIPDLLTDDMLQIPNVQQKKESFQLKESIECFHARCIDIIEVSKTATGYAIEFELYEPECGYYVDWIMWGDLPFLYECKIFVDNELYEAGRYERFCGTTVYELNGNSEFRPKLDLEGFNYEFNELVKLAPKRYRPLKIKDFQNKIDKLKGEIRREEILMERDQLMTELGIDINEDKWLRFVTRESGSIADVRDIYNWYMKGDYYDTRESMETVLKLRAKKNRGSNDELADCYDALLADFEQVIESKLADRARADETFEKEQESRLAEERKEFLRKCAQETADGNTYYVGAVIDDVEYMNQYTVIKTTASDKIIISFWSTRQEPWGPELDCSESFQKSVEPASYLDGISKTEFFNLLNSDAPEGTELIDKDVPMVYDDPDKYIERLIAIGLKITDPELEGAGEGDLGSEDDPDF